MTLREALVTVDLSKVYSYINKKDSKMIAKCDRPTMEITINAYSNVVKELLALPHTRKYSMSILVTEQKSWYDKHKYTDVCFLNSKYVKPPKGLKPWGGKNPPPGHYNCNLNKYNEQYAFGLVPWEKIIDTPIINKMQYPLPKVVGEILWQLTFYGWTSKETSAKVNELKARLNESVKSSKNGTGEFVELSELIKDLKK